jgi:hypothetical protein
MINNFIISSLRFFHYCSFNVYRSLMLFASFIKISMVFRHQYYRPVQHLFVSNLYSLRRCLHWLLAKYDVGRRNHLWLILMMSFGEILRRYLHMLNSISLLLFIDYHDVRWLREYKIGRILWVEVINISFFIRSLSILIRTSSIRVNILCMLMFRSWVGNHFSGT